MSNEPVLLAEAQCSAYSVGDYFIVPTFGAASITTYFGGCQAVIVRNSAGNYTITFARNYRTLLGFSGGFQIASGATLEWHVVSETLATNGQMIVEARVAAGTATDPAAGNKGFLRVAVSNDYMNDKMQV